MASFAEEQGAAKLCERLAKARATEASEADRLIPAVHAAHPTQQDNSFAYACHPSDSARSTLPHAGTEAVFGNAAHAAPSSSDQTLGSPIAEPMVPNRERRKRSARILYHPGEDVMPSSKTSSPQKAPKAHKHTSAAAALPPLAQNAATANLKSAHSDAPHEWEPATEGNDGPWQRKGMSCGLVQLQRLVNRESPSAMYAAVNAQMSFGPV